MAGTDLTRVLSYYDVGEFQHCRRVPHGYVNRNWIVDTTRGCFFVKRRHASLNEPDLVSAQHALVQHLRQVDFPAPDVIPTRNGDTFLELQGQIYEIHAYIPGVLCDISKSIHFDAAARTLGWYHCAVQGLDHPVFHKPDERYTPTALAGIVGRLKQAWQGEMSLRVKGLIDEIQAQVRDLAARFSEWGDLAELVIHGDYYADNLIFQGDEVAGVVDYDLAHWSTRATELAEALIYFAAERPGRFNHIVYPGVLDLTAVDRFLEAYSEVAPLTEAEIRALPDLMRTIWLCASLDPPLGPALSLEAAPQALPEILTLAGWAETHAPEVVEVGLSVKARQK